MPRIHVKGPRDTDEQELELGRDGALLIGRSPTPERLKMPGVTAPPQVLTVAEASVSANHVLAWSDEGVVHVRDLGSRNGTWLALPRGETIRVGDHDLELELARAGGGPGTADDPRAPEYGTPGEYAQALVESIQHWPGLRTLDVDVRIGDGDANVVSNSFPLANGQFLAVFPRSTVHANWIPVIERVWRWVAQQNTIFEAEQLTRNEGVILASPAIRAAHRQVVDAARSEARVLLLMGPSGAGKEMLAEVFHRHSGRSGPFVAVNCALFNKDLLRSELFGAEAGSFSGAIRRIVGAVERAQGGTLFVDEIGELTPDVQPMLLRFLDRLTYEPIGFYGKPHQADVSVVAATNKDLRAAARSGEFRSELWYRLSIHVVEVPGLTSRWDDIAAYLDEARLPGRPASLLREMPEEALEVLRSHNWEGNFRELANFRQRLLRGSFTTLTAERCRKLLAEGSLRTGATSNSPLPASEQAAAPDWAALCARAVEAYRADYGRVPSSWDDQKEWNEKYLKPLLFHQLGEVGDEVPKEEGALTSLASRAAARARADRGTALKQLARFFERYRG